MSEIFQNKYRIDSARLKNWDYSSPGAYFITLCVNNHEMLLGKIRNGQMILSDYGKITLDEREKSFMIRKEICCDEYVIMPNHIHVIIFIEKPFIDKTYNVFGDAPPCVSTGNKYGIAYRTPKSISSFVAGFKSVVTNRIIKTHQIPCITFWQTRFHDHIIRDEKEYNSIKNYILTNPANWDNDRYCI